MSKSNNKRGGSVDEDRRSLREMDEMEQGGLSPPSSPSFSHQHHDTYLMDILAKAQASSGLLGHTSILASPTTNTNTGGGGGGGSGSNTMSPATAATAREFPTNELKAISTWGLLNFYKMSVHLPHMAFENARSIAVTIIPLLARTVAKGASEWGVDTTTTTNTTNTTAPLPGNDTLRTMFQFAEVVSNDKGSSSSAAIHSNGSGGDVLMGLLFAMVSLGTVAANVPSGMLARTYPLRYVPLACGIIYGLATLLLVVVFPMGSYNLVYTTLILVCFLWGAAFSPYSVGRLLFVQHSVPKAWRPRLMSMVGGGQRWAMVSGPFVAGVVTDYFPGGIITALAIQIPLVVLNMFFLLKSSQLKQCSDEIEEQKLASRAKSRDNALERASSNPSSGAVTRANSQIDEPTFFQEIKDNIFIVLVIGTFAMIVQIMRGNRTMLLTVRALNLGLSPSFVGTVLSVSFFVDATFFLIGGYVGEKFGTRFQTVVASGGLGLSFLLLALPVDGEAHHGLAVFQLVFVSVLFGFANSLGAGLVLTLVATHAPKSKGNGVLTVMRSMQDAGPLFGSLVAGIILEYVTFGWSCSVFGLLGVANAIMAGSLIPNVSKE